MIRILIADDHTIVRRGISQILMDEFSSVQIDEVANSEAMILQSKKVKYDVIISDISMPGKSGLEVLPQLKELNPNVPILIMSIHSEDHYAVRVLKAGASGYLNKDLAPEELVSAVKRVLQGRRYITPTVAEKISLIQHNQKDKPLHYSLSDREFTVMQLLASGKSSTEISERLSLSITTVSTYRSRILFKMNLKTNADLTLYALQEKLI